MTSWSPFLALVGLYHPFVHAYGIDQEGTLDGVFSELESVGYDLTTNGQQQRHVVEPTLESPEPVSVLGPGISQLPLAPQAHVAAPSEALAVGLSQIPDAPSAGVVSLLTSVSDPMKGPLLPMGHEAPKVMPDAPKGVVSLLMSVQKMPQPKTTGGADVLGAPLVDDLPPQDFDRQDPETEVQTVMGEHPAQRPVDPKAESALPPELVFLVPESEQKAAVEPTAPVRWVAHWNPGDPAAGAEPKVIKQPKQSIKAVLKSMEDRRQSLLRIANTKKVAEAVPYIPPISDAEVRALFKPQRQNPKYMTWKEFARSPSRLQAAHNIYFKEMRAANLHPTRSSQDRTDGL
jgi:hypothetical protein